MGRVYLVMLCLCCSLWTTAQSGQDSTLRTYELQGLVFSQDRLRTAEVGLQRIEPDSLIMEQFSGGNLSELLRISAAAQIRSYGSSGLTTPAFRGTGGSHTAIVWNGINIQSPTSGQQDFSLLPVTFVDDLSILKGGSATLYGSGAMGGTIHLNNPAKFGQGLTIGTTQEIGSFGNHFQGYKANWSSDRFHSTTRFFHRTIDNEYPYTNLHTRPHQEENRINAAVKQYGMMQNNHFRIGEHQMLGVNFWWQENEIEIPEIVLASGDGEAVQQDDFFRGLLSWSYDKDRFGISIKQALFWYELFYAPTPSSEGSITSFLVSQQMLEVQYQLSDRWQWLSGLIYKMDKGDGDNIGTPNRHNLTWLNGLKFVSMNNRLTLAVNLREEIVDSKFVPFTASIGANYRVSDKVVLRTNLSRNYRIPTFNDLYWQSEGFSGNPDLKSEYSWNGEVGADMTLVQTSTASAEMGVTVYSNSVNNWIAWQPDESNEWSPRNIKAVWARGLELSAKGSLRMGSFDISSAIEYNYVRSTNEETGNDLIEGRQLIYTPQHVGSVLLSTRYKQYTLTANANYTGSQFTDEQYLSFRNLPEYNVFNIALSRTVALGTFRGGVRLELNNLFDKQYENRRGYPMYGRNFTLGLNLNFNKKYDE